MFSSEAESAEFVVLQSHDFEDETRQLSQDKCCVLYAEYQGYPAGAPARAQLYEDGVPLGEIGQSES